MPESIHDCLFLLWRVTLNFTLSRSCVVALPLLETVLILNLTDIDGRTFMKNLYIHTFLDIRLDLCIGGGP